MRLLLKNNQATLKLGQALAQSIDDRAVIALSGPLGAGKTTLVKAVAQGLGVTEVVTSPTFTMLNEYHSGRLPLYHMDLYRLSEGKTPAPLDLLIAELEEFLETPMVAMFEWAELFPDVNEPPDSGVSPADKSLGYLSQLDHLVVKLDYGSPPEAAQYGLFGTVQPDQNDLAPENGINKDEDLRIADLAAHGRQSAEVLIRLQSQVAAMLMFL